jgi:hypothetical protein
MEAFVSMRALEGNVGAQLTGVVWQACDEVMERTPKGNRACMMRELFTWVKECNETMQEFEELMGLGQDQDQVSSRHDDGHENNDKNQETGNDKMQQSEKVDASFHGWDEFCENLGTGQQYAKDEIPIIRASLALMKCSRGIIGLTLKALECAGSTLESDCQQDGTNKEGSVRYHPHGHAQDVFQWMSHLHETCREIGNGTTNIGCAMYPPLNLTYSVDIDGGDDHHGHGHGIWTRTEIGKLVVRQRELLLSVVRAIESSFSIQESGIRMSTEVQEMCQKLLLAIVNRTSEFENAMEEAISGRE